MLSGAQTWDVEQQVQEALRNQPGPSACPADRLFVPENLRSQVLQWGHNSRLACHPGSTRTCHLLTQRFWWPSLRRDVREYVRACPTCNQSKSSNQPPSGLLQPLPVPSRPWSHVSLDFVTGLPPSDGILTIVDRFSKMAHFVPLPKLPSAKETAQVVALLQPLPVPFRVYFCHGFSPLFLSLLLSASTHYFQLSLTLHSALFNCSTCFHLLSLCHTHTGSRTHSPNSLFPQYSINPQNVTHLWSSSVWFVTISI